jgi:hypothetical protein
MKYKFWIGEMKEIEGVTGEGREIKLVNKMRRGDKKNLGLQRPFYENGV